MTRLLALDVAATLRERKVWLAAAFFAYAILTLPVLFEKPPPHIDAALQAFFGSQEPFVLFMYLWTDLAMNKLIAVVAVVLGGGVILRERDSGVLAVVASKPLTLPRYFLLRAGSACIVMGLLYLLGHLAAGLLFSRKVVGFRSWSFVASMSVHMWTAIFATALAATLAVVIRRRGVAALVSILLLFSLVGMSFIGFYNPQWQDIARVNPFSLGVIVLSDLDSPSAGLVLLPSLVLIAITTATLALGAWSTRRMEA